MDFFGMENKDGRVVKNRSSYHILDVGDSKKKYYDSVLNKPIYLLPSPVLVAEDDKTRTLWKIVPCAS